MVEILAVKVGWSKMAEKLKLCPFCSSKNEDFRKHSESCFLCRLEKQSKTDCMAYCKEAMEWAWNRRVGLRKIGEKIMSIEETNRIAREFDKSEAEANVRLENKVSLWRIIKQLQAESKEWRDALQELYDWQNGPPLIRDEKPWQKAMDEASRLLSKP